MKKTFLTLITAAFLLACNLATTHPSDLRTPAAEPEATSAIASESVGATAPSVASAANPTAAPPEGVGPVNFPAGINPLTGLPVSDPAVLERRPVAVKINNYPRSNRPQWGLSLADIVFEYYHNNDLPRFHAIFYSRDAELAGPIRSGRLLDVHLLHLYHSNFVFGSADARILDQLQAQRYADRLVYLLDGAPCPPQPVCRFEPNVYNYLLTSTAATREYLSLYRNLPDDRPYLDGMWFNLGLPQGGQPLERLHIRYSYGAYLYWQWDPTTGRYLRYQDAQDDVQGRGETYELLTDRLTGEAIAAENVVVLFVPHRDEVYQPPANGNPAVEIIDIQLEDSGPAYALRDGQLFEVRWLVPQAGVLTLTFTDGTLYPYKPGVTWYQVVSTKTNPRIDGLTAWFDFVLR